MGLSLYWPNNIAIRCIKKKDYKITADKVIVSGYFMLRAYDHYLKLYD